MKKKVFWAIVDRPPVVGKTLTLTKVDIGSCVEGTFLKQETVETTPIKRIHKFGENMCILCTEDTNYAVYYTEK